VAIDDTGVAEEMQRMFLQDLDNATEIVLSHNRVRNRTSVGAPIGAQAGLRLGDNAATSRQSRRAAARQKGSAAAGAIRVANAVGAAITTDVFWAGPKEACSSPAPSCFW
jgi:cardiolipin synthase